MEEASQPEASSFWLPYILARPSPAAQRLNDSAQRSRCSSGYCLSRPVLAPLAHRQTRRSTNLNDIPASEEADEVADQAQSYLRQSWNTSRRPFPLLKLPTFVPLLHDPVETTHEFVGEGLTHRDLPNKPLADLAFVRAEFSPITRYPVDPLRGIPLVQAQS